jgi:hypothetical protein
VLKQATPAELENNPELTIKALTGREIDAFAASRARLTVLSRRSGAVGVEAADAGPVSRHGCPG